MQYPLISEYIEAIRSAEDNFDKLSNLRPVLDSNGNPVMSSGNFAVVFKMEDVSTHRLFAVKCFIKEQEGRGERYALIAEELQYVSSPYLLHVRYLERELFVSTAGCDEEELPVLVMDWVEGQPLDAYLKQHLNNRYDLEMLAYRFCKMGAWLLSQPFAHGDLKPDNILVREDGSLVLVDYDGMYVSTMEGQTAAEMGSPDFRHPLRTEKDFNEHIDDFSLASIALSLKAISLDSKLYSQYAAADRLLFSASDYRDIGKSTAFQAVVRLASNAELSTLLAAFHLALAKTNLNLASFRVFVFNEPEKPSIDELLTTTVSEQEWETIELDDQGAYYTADGLKLVFVPKSFSSYEIKNGTKVICDNAFYHNYLAPFFKDRQSSLQSVSIPNSLIKIGKGAFSDCKLLQSITLPDNVISIGDFAFASCSSLQSISAKKSIKVIGQMAFLNCSSLQSISIPDGVTSIKSFTFGCCSSLQSISIPNGVENIGSCAFARCTSLQSIVLPNSMKSIEYGAFRGCSSLRSISIPNSVKSIGSSVFNRCDNLQSCSIESSYFKVSNNILFTITGVLLSCWSKSSHIDLFNNIITIADDSFSGCSYLQSISIPNSVTSIGIFAFAPCTSLQSVILPNSITSIGNFAFFGCTSLQSVFIPQSITSIGDSIFCECESLQVIYIPTGARDRIVNMIGFEFENKIVEV